jgi:hypothetical protein
MSPVGSFARGFVARLITSGISAIQPHAPEDRRGFQAVVDFLDNEIKRLRGAAANVDRGAYMQLVRMRNELKASNSGAFDAFETALRDLQLSLTSSPNAFYEEIEFNVSKPYAESLVGELPPFQRDLVSGAAEAFLRERRAGLSTAS